MKSQLLEFSPLLAFFFFLATKDIYWATSALMITTFLQAVLHYIIYKKFKKMHIVGFVLSTLFGTMTLLLHDPMFIKWKFSILQWLLSLILLWRLHIKKINPVKELIELVTKEPVPAPDTLYKRLAYIWFVVMLTIGGLNLVLVYYIFPTNDAAWGYSKTALVFVGLFALMFYTIFKLQPYMPEQEQHSNQE